MGRTLKIGCVWTIATLLTLELLLRLVDPLGIVFLEDIGGVFDVVEYQESLYVLPPGEYQFRTFTATILNDHTRRVPDTSITAPCIVVAIGDSATFGHGVEDEQTWVNLLALEFPNVRFVNTGMNGFNSRLVMLMQQRWKGMTDGFIYYVITNDIENEPPAFERGGYMSYTSAYLIYWLMRSNEAATKSESPAHFGFDLTVIQETAPTLFFTSDPDFAPLVRRYVAVTEIPQYTSTNSAADPHANAAGNQEIASAMLPVIEMAIRRWC